jgi:hypothetical protein
MRTLLKVQMSVQAGNRAIKDGTIGKLMEQAMAELKPEYAYFYAENGKRSANFIFDLKDPSDIPHHTERFFREMDAEVTMCPVMNAEDLKVGLGKLAR